MIITKFRGTLDSIGEVKGGVSQKTGKEWKMVDVIFDVPDGRYSDKIIMTASNKMVDEILACQIGEEVAVEAYIYAREYNDRMYNNINLSKLYRHSAASPAAPARPAAPAPVYAPQAAAPVYNAPANDNPENDLPF